MRKLPKPDSLLQLFTAIDGSGALTQRGIAALLKVSLGHANALLQNAIGCGYVACNGRGDYKLTSEGRTEMSTLTYGRMNDTIGWYKVTRERIRDNFVTLVGDGVRRVVFYGAGNVAEVAYGVLEGMPVKLVSVVDDFRAGEGFFVLCVLPARDLLKMDYDRIVVTTFKSAGAIREQVGALGIPDSHLFFFH